MVTHLQPGPLALAGAVLAALFGTVHPPTLPTEHPHIEVVGATYVWGGRPSASASATPGADLAEPVELAVPQLAEPVVLAPHRAERGSLSELVPDGCYTSPGKEALLHPTCRRSLGTG